MNNNILYFLWILPLVSCINTYNGPTYEPAVYECTTNFVNTHPKANKLQQFLDNKVAEGLPGISLLVETPEGIWTGAAGLAELEFSTPMKACNLHAIGSSSKVFTATLIFQLFEEGLLGFDDLVADHLDHDLVKEVANIDSVSIRNLLSHTSGIPDYLDINYSLNYYDDLTRIWTPEEELSMIYGEEAVFKVGEYVNYSNSNFILLGMIARKLRADSAESALQDHIFDPLGMDNTYFSDEGDLPKNLVRGYTDESGKGRYIDVTGRSFARGSMAGGVISNVEDMHAFLKATWTCEDIFKPSTKELIIRITDAPKLRPSVFEYGADDIVKRLKGIGLCWFQYETEYGLCYGHDGGFDGRRSVMRYFPQEDVFVTYLVNGSGPGLKSILNQMRRNDIFEVIFE